MFRFLADQGLMAADRTLPDRSGGHPSIAFRVILPDVPHVDGYGVAGLPRLQLTGPGEGKGEGVGELPRQPQGEDAAVPVDRVGIDREGPGIGTGETGVQDRLVVSELMTQRAESLGVRRRIPRT